MAICRRASAVVALTLACAWGATLEGACPASVADSGVEDVEESGLLQPLAARHLQRPTSGPCTTPLKFGKECTLPTEECEGTGRNCPCGAGLTCKPCPKSGNCKGFCLKKDGQYCTCDTECAGGVCAGNIYKKGGLCKTRTGNFTINLIDVSGGIVDENPRIKRAFAQAAARYTQIIKGQVVLNLDVTVDIEYSVEPIDGPGGVLGFAGPTAVNGASLPAYGIRWLPIGGIMVFDIEDFTTEMFEPLINTIILHEMAHVLGIGTLQEPTDVLPFPDSYDMTDCEKTGGADGRYNSLDGFATAAYLWSKGYIPTGLPSNFTRARLPPIETGFSTGTQCGHWDEATLDNELMTGFISLESNPLSIITIGGFEDLGYVVEYEPADAYEVPVEEEVISSARASRGMELDSLMESPKVSYIQPGHRQAADFVKQHTDRELGTFRSRHATKRHRTSPR